MELSKSTRRLMDVTALLENIICVETMNKTFIMYGKATKHTISLQIMAKML